ncbi:PREDICTED: uncharacterized protein LOC106816943 [Priapulus caudatus]|uniref:Uncharacterized protein LOC106816943 n=1 Tax=Priapulus caudatus TaxID=37621 RepID=A0ABM1EY06_PRICU|nr:PREDICTED: uncharacterized protein LOC106816943 [Priapulus caudatus]
MLAEFITAQKPCMVNVIAFNCFILIVFGKKLRFGPYDMWLLLWTFGAPFLGSVINVSLGYLGPNGVFCYFDVKLGALAGIFYTTVPLLLVLLLNTLLYIGTWKNIRNQALQIKGSETQQAVALRRVHDSASTMTSPHFTMTSLLFAGLGDAAGGGAAARARQRAHYDVTALYDDVTAICRARRRSRRWRCGACTTARAL